MRMTYWTNSLMSYVSKPPQGHTDFKGYCEYSIVAQRDALIRFDKCHVKSLSKNAFFEV